MSLEQAYYVSQICAAVLLIASVVFLALQVRQNSKIIERLMVENNRNLEQSIYDEISRSRDFAAFHMRISDDYDGMDQIDKYRAEYFALRNLTRAMFLVQARVDGHLPDAEWRTLQARMRFASKRKNVQAVWEKIRGNYPAEVQRLWNQTISS